MFNEQLNLVCLTRNQREYARIQKLINLSNDLQVHGIHPAQGLRIARRLKAANNKLTDKQILMQICSLLQNKIASVNTKNDTQVEHFLTSTILPQPINTVTGYVSPVIDIQPDIHFIRTQRRYNKRRYARVRAVSRPSFWSGMMLSTLATGAF